MTSYNSQSPKDSTKNSRFTVVQSISNFFNNPKRYISPAPSEESQGPSSKTLTRKLFISMKNSGDSSTATAPDGMPPNVSSPMIDSSSGSHPLATSSAVQNLDGLEPPQGPATTASTGQSSGRTSNFAGMERREEHYIPTPEDVYAVRRDLRRLIPPEIVILIVEAAQYWPKVTWPAVATAKSGTGYWIISQTHGPQCYLVTPPLSQWTGLKEGYFKPREIRFKITSHDQGWTTDNVQGYTTLYMGSRTWFEAAIIRDFRQHEGKEFYNLNDVDALLKRSINTREPKITINHLLIQTSHTVRAEGGAVTTVRNPADDSDVWHIQRNVRASLSDTIHEVVWTGVDPNDNMDEMKCRDATGAGRGIGFVRSLQREDRIAVIGRALYEAWNNHVRFIQVEMTYSV